MHIKEIITETFDSIYSYERSMDGGYFQDSEGTTISVLFDNMAPGIWAVAFQRGVLFSMTGSGDQFKILATVIAIIKEWANEAKPDILTFSSNKEDKGRSNAYGAIVKRLIKDTGYVNVTDNIRLVNNEKHRDWLERAIRHYRSSDIFILARQDQVKSQVNELFEPKTAFKVIWNKELSNGREQYATAYDRQGREIDISFFPRTKEIVDIEFTRGGSHSVTGKGDAERVLGAVIIALKQYVQRFNPQYIVFAGNDASSRYKLYTALINRFSPQLGYHRSTMDKVEEIVSGIPGYGKETFVLERN